MKNERKREGVGKVAAVLIQKDRGTPISILQKNRPTSLILLFGSLFRKRISYTSQAIRLMEVEEAVREDLRQTAADSKQNYQNWVNDQKDDLSSQNKIMKIEDTREDMQGIEQELSDFKSPQSSSSCEQDTKIIKEGWLFKRNTSRKKMNKWSKRWFILSEHSLYYIRGNNPNQKKIVKKKVCNLILSTVRECNSIHTGKRRKMNGKIRNNSAYRFEVISADGSSAMLQVLDESKADYDAWVQTLRTRTYQLIVDEDSVVTSSLADNDPAENNEQTHENLPQRIKTKMSASNIVKDTWVSFTRKVKAQHLMNEDIIEDVDIDNLSDSYISETSTQYTDKSGSVVTSFGNWNNQRYNLLPAMNHQEDNITDRPNFLLERSMKDTLVPNKDPVCSRQIIERIMQQNPCCADCGKAAPEWASLNLGVLVCIECSGVHRSLGAHISQIRSLRLDEISESEASLLLELGNEKVNAFKGGKGGAVPKPSSQSPQSMKQAWINWKYVESKVQGEGNASNEDSKVTVRNANHELYMAARDCDILKVAKELSNGGNIHWRNEKNGRTPLHACILSSIQKKSRSNYFSSSSTLSADSIRIRESNTKEFIYRTIVCAELLLKNGARISQLDNELENVYDCACRHKVEQEILEYLSRRHQPRSNNV